MKKKIGYKKRLGENEECADQTEFAGEERKVWLYINRIKRHVDANMIRSYIKGKSNFTNEKVEVTEIPSEQNGLKRFVVRAPISRKDEMYDTNFWPKGVGIKRFSFHKHREFLNNEAFFQNN